MSKDITIAIYSNLPSGGALSTQLSTEKYLAKYYKVVKILEPKYSISSFVDYLYKSLVISPSTQKKLINTTPHDLLLAYHSWLIKTPSVLRYSEHKKIYVCHESMREYYDKEHIAIQNIMERLVNILRLPIKWLDKYNAKSPNTTVIVNSIFSKKMIDNAYNVDSVVIYPGIDVKKYNLKANIRKLNQVICVSAINKFKGQNFLIDVVASIPVSIRPELVLIGNGSNAEYLSKITAKANLLKVKLKIRINATEEEKIQELHKSIIFLYAPLSEPFGLVIEEAMAAGLPLLVYKYGGGYSEITSELNGLIMDNLDPKLWGIELTNLIKDKRRLVQLSKHNMKYAKEKLDESSMNKQLLSIVKENL